MTARVVFHLPEEYRSRYETARHLALYPAIAALITRRGGTVVLAGRPGPKTPGAKRRRAVGDLHLVEGGRIRRTGFLNAALAYLPGFWHLDPVGVLADSSMATRPFDASKVDGDKAEAFYQGLRREFALTRQSRYGQMRAETVVPEGAIVVFLQGAAPLRRGQAHLDHTAMLRAVAAAADGRPVLAKPHPLSPAQGRAVIAEVCAEGHAVAETGANVHDLLAGSAVSVSINSAAAIEGFLHGTPAVLCGRSDFAVMAETVIRAEDMAPAIARALATPRDYARWFHWYFAENCLNLAAEDFEVRLLAIFAKAGFDAARLGLDG